MIKRIYADNYRCLGNFEFRPQQLNLLLGENGSGKTSLLEVLMLVSQLTVGGASAASLFASRKTVWDSRDIQTFKLEVVDGDAGATYSYRLQIRHPPQPDKPHIGSEELDFNGQPLFRYTGSHVHLFEEDHSPGPVFPFKPEQSFLPNLESKNSKLRWFKDFLAGIHIFQLNPFVLSPFSARDERYLTINGSNFASWLRHLSEEDPEAKLECEKQLTDILPGFQRFRFSPMGDHKALVADFSKNGASYNLLFNNLSEGQRILSVLYSIIYGLAGKASVLCFDEPENFISLREVQPWLQSLRDLVEDRSGQALVISHHPEVIDYLAADSAFRFERPAGGLARVEDWIPDPTKIMRPSEILIQEG